MSQEETLPQPWRRRLYIPSYTVAAAARYARTNPGTVSYWHRGGRLGPTLPDKKLRVPLNYFQLVEVAFVATFRSLGVSLQRLRKAHANLAQVFEAEYPFAQFRLKTEGVHVIMNLQQADPDAKLGTLVIADSHGQLAWEEHIGDRFAEFDYEHDFAATWHPAGRDSLVTIDPRVSFGAPQVGGIPTWAIRGRSIAGEPPDEIAEDFGVSIQEVRSALEFEKIKLAA